MGITKQGITAAECQLFSVDITQHDGNGTWGFIATATLTFEGGTTLAATGSLKLSAGQNPTQDSKWFSSSDAYPYFSPEKTANTPPDSQLVDDTSKFRFEFNGSQITLGRAAGSFNNLPADDFQYDPSSRQIHSFQVEDSGSPALITGAPSYDDSSANLEATDLESFIFCNKSSHKILGALNNDKLDYLFQILFNPLQQQ